MPLERGEVLSYNCDRMVVEFTLLNQGKVILCAISTAAMDDRSSPRFGDSSAVVHEVECPRFV